MRRHTYEEKQMSAKRDAKNFWKKGKPANDQRQTRRERETRKTLHGVRED